MVTNPDWGGRVQAQMDHDWSVLGKYIRTAIGVYSLLIRRLLGYVSEDMLDVGPALIWGS